MVEEYQRERLKTKAWSTVDKEMVYLLRMIRKNGFQVEKSSRKPGREVRNRSFAPEELDKFFQHCPEKLKTLFLLLYATGTRPAELVPSSRSNHVAVLKSDVDREQNLVTIRPWKVRPGEKREARVVQLMPS